MKQTTIAEKAWENGYIDCLTACHVCHTRPCTAAQGVFCCKDCPFNKDCVGRCKKK